ncbi:MAG: hypothetical protein A2Z31_07755 [candidate division NC10 bacterium RBG_16_65_8]|nr:MAG: hypothetical protein A2Z31_07755 [candidate division NC10 bacterium RBG_16_65_8]
MNWEMREIRFALLVLVGSALSGCAADGSFTGSAPQATPYPPPGYSHTVQSSAVVLYWNCAQPEPTVVELNGLAFNPWSSQPVRSLEVELVGVDSRERTVSEVGAEARDRQILTNQSTPFHLRLRTAGSESRLDLYYRYKFQDGGRDRMLAGLAWDAPILLAQQVQFRVRDACSETQHRVR